MSRSLLECYAAYVSEKVAHNQLKIVGISDSKHQAQADITYQEINQIWKAQECCVCIEPLWNPHVYTSQDFPLEMRPDIFCRLGCGHVVCAPCIKGIHEHIGTCPICRAPTGNLSVGVPALASIVQSIGQLVAPGEHPAPEIRQQEAGTSGTSEM